MKVVGKHIALIAAVIMSLTVIPGIAGAKPVCAKESDLAKPRLINHAAGSTSIKNRWNKVKGARGYEIFRSTKLNGKYKKVKTIKKGKTLSWTNKKLKRNTSYYYKVRAYKKVGGKKEYSKFSNAQWAAATTYPNWTYSLSKKAKKTKTVSLKITNKSKAAMRFTKEGVYLKNKNARKAWNRMSAQEQETASASALKKKGIYRLKAAKKYTVRPGKSVTLKYRLHSKIKYSKNGYIEGYFRYDKQDYGIRHSYHYGESIWMN